MRYLILGQVSAKGNCYKDISLRLTHFFHMLPFGNKTNTGPK